MLESMNREFMMLRRNRATARVRAPAPRPVEIILSAEARRKFADFIMLLDTAERRSGVIKNERKKVKLSKTRDGPQSSGLFLFLKLLCCYGQFSLGFYLAKYNLCRSFLGILIIFIGHNYCIFLFEIFKAIWVSKKSYNYSFSFCF